MVRGRKPLASAIKEASGAFIKDPQRRNKNEPKAKRGWPEKPENVKADSIASECWDKVCTTLDELNILTTADVFLLEAYCIDYSQWRWLSEMCSEGRVAGLTAGGSATATPEASQVHKYADRLLKRQAELGLTPSARSRLHTPEEKQDDPFTAWLTSDN
jgi:P27 family predicted phage terminase small subunit